jgi:5-methyltetrahydropteroyltriglutamate--homocysteine methyltransferase
MQRSAERILTTHVGSLPRPAELEAMLLSREKDQLDAKGQDRLPGLIVDAVNSVVRRQAELGIDIVCDGEMGRYAYCTYARERMSGLDGEDQPLALSELVEFPTFAQRIKLDIKTPACVGPVSYRGKAALATDVDNLKAAVGAVDVEAALASWRTTCRTSTTHRRMPISRPWRTR